MSCRWIDKILIEWGEGIICNQADDYTEIEVPFVDAMGDYISLYVYHLSNNKLRISDSGMTVNRLFLNGVDIVGQSTILRKEKIQGILDMWGVLRHNLTLYINLSEHEVGSGIMRMVHVIQQLTSFCYAVQVRPIMNFKRDVVKFFHDNKTRITEKPELTGKKQQIVLFDFKLNGNPDLPPVIGNSLGLGNFQLKIKNFLYDIGDLQDGKEAFNPIVIIDDRDYRQLQPKLKHVDILRREGIPHFLFKNDAKQLAQLAGRYRIAVGT